jgi:hypothetical protein
VVEQVEEKVASSIINGSGYSDGEEEEELEVQQNIQINTMLTVF